MRKIFTGVWRKLVSENNYIWAGPGLLAILFIILFASIVLVLIEVEYDDLRAHLKNDSEFIQNSVIKDLEAHQVFLDELGKDLLRHNLNENAFDQITWDFTARHNDVEVVFWADADSVIRRAVYTNEEKRKIGQKISLPDQAHSFKITPQKRSSINDPLFGVINDDKYLEIYSPCYNGDTLAGIFGASYSCRKLLENSVRRIHKEFPENNQLRLLDPNGEVVAELPTIKAINPNNVLIVPLNSDGPGLSLQITQYQRNLLSWEISFLVMACLGLIMGMIWSLFSHKLDLAARRKAEEELLTIQDSLEIRIEERTDKLRETVKKLVDEINEKKLAQNRRRFITQILKDMNQGWVKSDTLREILRKIKEFGGYDGVALRVKKGDDYTLVETLGYPDGFFESENILCKLDSDGKVVCDNSGKPLLECLCGKVISCKTDCDFSNHTKTGSFWINDLILFMRNIKNNKSDIIMRNSCIAAGIRSAAYIPLRSGSETVGLLVLGDKRINMFSPDIIEFFEEVAASLGVAIARKAAEEQFQASENKFKSLIQNTTNSFNYCRIINDKSGEPIDFEFIEINDAFEKLAGIKRSDIVGRRITELFPNMFEKYPDLIDPVRKIKDADKEYKFELYFEPWGKWLSYNAYGLDKDHFVTLIEDITERKQAEQRLIFAGEILGLLNSTDETPEIIRQILTVIKNYTGFQAVGIRLKEKDDYPYIETIGFPEQFVIKENNLCVRNNLGEILRDKNHNPFLECMCGNVLSGRCNSSLPFFSDAGSFWTNSTSDLLASTTENDRQARTRNRCNGEGYETVVLIPLKSYSDTLGLIQLNDKRGDMLRPGMLSFLEKISTSIGIALARKQAEEKIIMEREKARKYLDIAGTILMALNSKGEVSLINKKGCSVLEYDEKDILGKNWFENYIPKGLNKDLKREFDRLISGDIGIFEYHENEIVSGGGQEKMIAWHNTLLRDSDNNIIGTLSSGEDITLRKVSEKRLFEYQRQLRSLATELSMAEERERRRIAADLHDRIGQNLVSSKLKLSLIRPPEPDSEMRNGMDEVIDLLEKTIRDTWSLTFELSPPILYELGLGKAIEWLGEQFESQYGIPVEFYDDGLPQTPDESEKVIIFRAVREILLNVAKHSGASWVKVSIMKSFNDFAVKVEDDGVGFDPLNASWEINQSGGFGLFSIRERLESIGGRIIIDSRPSDGCRVTIIAPLNKIENSTELSAS